MLIVGCCDEREVESGVGVEYRCSVMLAETLVMFGGRGCGLWLKFVDAGQLSLLYVAGCWKSGGRNKSDQ